jgi:hypothetical protein
MPPPVGTEAARSPRPKLGLRLRALVRLRRRFGWLLALAPVLTVVGFDLATRGERLVALPAKYLGSYSLAILESAILWASLMIAASARRGVSRFVAGALFVLLFTAAIGGQVYFHGQYATYLNLDATLFGTSFSQSVFGQLSADGRTSCGTLLPAVRRRDRARLLGRRCCARAAHGAGGRGVRAGRAGRRLPDPRARTARCRPRRRT